MTVQDFLNNLDGSWLRALANEWRVLNDRHLGGALKPPVFQLDDSTTRMGAWSPQTRVISISRHHICSGTWLEVELTLRHEMAHQVVSELFEAPCARPHGELFAKASTMLQLEESPRTKHQAESESTRVLDRIRKLLSLATSDNENEAQIAMAKANRLLLQHNLTMAEANRTRGYGYRWVGQPLGRVPLEVKLLVGLLGRYFFVRPIWRITEDTISERRLSVLEIFGERHNLDIAEYVFDYVGTTLDRLWQLYRVTLPRGQARSLRNDFRVGVVMGFGEHLASQREVCEEQGLVWLGDPALDELFERRHPSRGRMGGGYYRQSAAHTAGIDAGRQIRLRGGLNDHKENRGRLLS